MDNIVFEDFEKVDIRVGEIVEVGDFDRARVPTYKLRIDFGSEIGVKWSSARYKEDYTPDQLLNRQCLAVVNLAPRNVAGFMSEVLVLGVDRDGGGISLATPLDKAVLGARLY